MIVKYQPTYVCVMLNISRYFILQLAELPSDAWGKYSPAVILFLNYDT